MTPASTARVFAPEGRPRSGGDAGDCTIALPDSTRRPGVVQEVGGGPERRISTHAPNERAFTPKEKVESFDG